jgi:hypothetical protein
MSPRPLRDQAGWAPVGLRVIDDVVSPVREAWTIEAMRREIELAKIEPLDGTRTLRVGFDYETQKKLSAMPWWLLPLRTAIRCFGVPEPFDNATLRECAPGYSIAPHIDHESFGDPIVIVNLGEGARFCLQRPGKRLDFRARRRSAVMLSAEARASCTHAVSTAADGSLRYAITLRRKLPTATTQRASSLTPGQTIEPLRKSPSR